MLSSCPVFSVSQPPQSTYASKQLSSQCQITLEQWKTMAASPAARQFLEFSWVAQQYVQWQLWHVVFSLQTLIRQWEADSYQDWVVPCSIIKWLQGLQNAVYGAACPGQTTIMPWYHLFSSSLLPVFLQTSISCLSFLHYSSSTCSVSPIP